MARTLLIFKVWPVDEEVKAVETVRDVDTSAIATAQFHTLNQ